MVLTDNAEENLMTSIDIEIENGVDRPAPLDTPLVHCQIDMLN